MIHFFFCIAIRFESNQISQTNQTSSIELVKVTETVLRAAHAGGQHDFVVFDVRTAITPNVKKVIAGDVILLQSSVATDHSGQWVAEPSGIVEIENIGTLSQGYGVALRSGQARISLMLSENRRITLDLVSQLNHDHANMPQFNLYLLYKCKIVFFLRNTKKVGYSHFFFVAGSRTRRKDRIQQD